MNLEHFQKELQEWNKCVFGNIFVRKRRLILELERIQRILYLRDLKKLRDRELELWLGIEDVHEELLWFQKSRANWLTNGDRNTRYFHSRSMVR